MVICLERGADLHVAQLMPLPLTVSCFSKIQIGLPFWYQPTWVVSEKGPLNGCMCVCVCSSVVCVSVGHNHELYKMAEPMKMSFGLWTRAVPRNHVLGGVLDSDILVLKLILVFILYFSQNFNFT